MSITIEDLIKSDREEYANISQIAIKLDRLADAMYETGNINLSEKLGKMASDLDTSVDTLQGNSAQRTNIRFEEAKQSSANVLVAALSAATQRNR